MYRRISFRNNAIAIDYYNNIWILGNPNYQGKEGNMLVKYIGKADQLIGEYDGKRYVFSKKRPIIDIPIKVYDYIKTSRGMRIADIVPHIAEPAPIVEAKVVPEIPKSKPVVKIKSKGKKK